MGTRRTSSRTSTTSTTSTTSRMSAPMPSLMSTEAGTPSLMTASEPVVLRVHQGDDKRWLFHLSKSPGVPFDLTGYTAALQFRTDVADLTGSTAVTPLCEVTDEPGGEITVTLPSELSQTLSQPSYMWDLEITEVAGSWTTTIAAGTLAVTKEVTRPGVT